MEADGSCGSHVSSSSLLSDSLLLPFRHQIYTQMEQSFAMQQNAMGVAEGETDEFKRVLLDTNPWILGLTVAVSLLHSVFDFLAFKNGTYPR